MISEHVERDRPGNVDLAAGRAAIGATASPRSPEAPSRTLGIAASTLVGADLRLGLRAEVLADAAGRAALLAGIFEHVAIFLFVDGLVRHLLGDDKIERRARNARQVEHVMSPSMTMFVFGKAGLREPQA